MAGPAILLIGLFVILPFVFAIGLSFTDQRLTDLADSAQFGRALLRFF